MAVNLPGRPIQRIKRAVSRAGSDSLVGALGATFIGGPLLGLGVGVLGGRLNAQELDRRSEDALLVREANQLMHDSIDEQRNRADNPEDLAQLNVIQQAMERAERMLAASSPQLQQQGADLIERVLDAQLQYETRNESQRIARDAADAAAEAAWGQQNWTRFSGLYDDLFRESSDFIAKRSSYGALLSAYRGVEEPGNVEDIAAINAIQRMIDPGVSVREGDVSIIQNMAGIPDLLLTGLNRITKDGGRFNPAERQALVQLGNRLMQSANEEQIGTNARFQQQGTAGGLPEGLIQQIRMPTVDTATGQSDISYGTPNASNAPAPSSEEAGRLVPVESALEQLMQDFTLPRVNPGEVGHFPPDVQDVLDATAQGKNVMVDEAGRVFLGSAFDGTQELTTTQAQRDEILRLQTGELSREQFAEITRRRRERSGVAAGRILRFGPDDTTNPNRQRVTN